MVSVSGFGLGLSAALMCAVTVFLELIKIGTEDGDRWEIQEKRGLHRYRVISYY